MEHDGRRSPGGALSACTKREKWSGKTGGRANFERLMCHEWMQESRASVWRGEAKVRLANPEHVAGNATIFWNKNRGRCLSTMTGSWSCAGDLDLT